MTALILTLLALLAAFTAAMFFNGDFNRAVAKRFGAPAGRSMSAHLWVLDVNGDDVGGFARAFVDAVAYVWTRGKQPNHCELAFLKESLK